MRTNHIIPGELRSKVDEELEPGEAIQWMDGPVPKFFTSKSTGAFVFGIPWTAFAVFWTFMVHKAGSSPGNDTGNLTYLFGIPFILIGFLLLTSPLFEYRRSFRTVYVVTNRRAIILEGKTTTTIKSYPPRKLKNLYRKERGNGTGDVVLEQHYWRDEGSMNSEEIGFTQINSVKDVEAMLKRLAESDDEQPGRS